jgi:hypothetical protein
MSQQRHWQHLQQMLPLLLLAQQASSRILL